jgi:hypothetical protein
MAKIIPFPVRSKDEDADPELDLMDIAARLDHPGREQADSCRKMLERSLDAARLGAW